jgi:hypothetical protein
MQRLKFGSREVHIWLAGTHWLVVVPRKHTWPVEQSELRLHLVAVES